MLAGDNSETKLDNCLWHRRNASYTVNCFSFQSPRTGDYLLCHCSEFLKQQSILKLLIFDVMKAEGLSMNSFQEVICQNHQILLGRGEGYTIFFQEGCVIFRVSCSSILS